MKKAIRSAFISILMILMCSTVFEYSGVLPLRTAEAHSGRTDAQGGHHDYKNASGLGSYHYHCGGHPAHLHPNGVCPYSGSASGSGSSSGSSSSSRPAPLPAISKKSASLYAGASLTLKVSNASQKVRWSSSKNAVATVNAQGKVTAKKKGTAVITALIGSRKLTCTLKVKALSLNKKKLTLTEGSSATLKIKGAVKKIKWTSSDKKVADVTGGGKVKAKSPGTATITATTMGKSYKCRVTVKKRIIPVEDFYLGDSSLNLKEGHTASLTFTVEPSNATDQEITWTSSDPNVASVSQGVVTGISQGFARITASCGGYEDFCYVNVEQDFVSLDAQNALTYITYTGRCGVIAEVTSSYRYPMYLDAECTFYDQSGSVVRTSRDSLDCLAPGQTLCMRFDTPYAYEGGPAYASCQISFRPESCRDSAGSVTCVEMPSADCLSVRADNTDSEYVSLIDITVIFFKNGEALSFESRYAGCYAPGSSSTLYFDYPRDDDGSLIIPDSYKVFVGTSR